jgi:prolyl-tRNA synthetase
MGTIVEVLADAKGIVWPKSVAPFAYHLLNLSSDDADVSAAANALYEEMIARGIEVLYDDRTGVTAGEKFNDSDLLGIPTRIVISKKTLAAQKFEVKYRTTGEVRLLEDAELRTEIFG